MGAAYPASLLVVLDDLLVARPRSLGVEPDLAQGAPLAQQIPALVEAHLELPQALPLGVVKAGVLLLALPQLVLLGDELLDPLVNRVVHLFPPFCRHRRRGSVS